MSLAGRLVALAEGRQLEDLARLLEKEGAVPLRYPLVSILDAPDPAPVAAWLRDLAAGRFDVVVFLTGEGVRRLLAVAGSVGLTDAVLATLSRVVTITRGPKPVQALKDVGLTPTRVSVRPTTEGVIATLQEIGVAGRSVGVQLFAPENPPLTEFLTSAGATVNAVLPYVYAPAADAEKVAELISRLEAGEVAALVITSTPQVTRLFEVATTRGLEPALRAGLERTCVAAVGPIAADAIRDRGVRVDVTPEQGFVMKNLVRQLARHFGG